MQVAVGVVLVALWCSFSCIASPFDPRPPPSASKRPYFLGWFLRCVDHDKGASFALILGSFRHPGRRRTMPACDYDEHYVSLSYLHDRPETHTFHAFPPESDVTITSGDGSPIAAPSPANTDANFAWEAAGLGRLRVAGDDGELSFALPGLRVSASFRGRQPWDPARPNTAGPEGVLARTRLLPLHYFVHSFGSDCHYSLQPAGRRAVKGRGRIHMEGNYGEVFPEGWVWAQGCSATAVASPAASGSALDPACGGCGGGGGGISESDTAQAAGPASFVLTGGRFIIGPLTTNSFVLAYRSPRLRWDFRTTELDRVVTKLSRATRRLNIVATSRGGGKRLELTVTAPNGSFGEAIYVPTPSGFSNKPGCVESYAATATFRCYSRQGKGKRDDQAAPSGLRQLFSAWADTAAALWRPRKLVEEVEMPLAALEFGGAYQDT